MTRKTLGLSMIVKNGGEDLRLCLESVRCLVDQIVIADTGSTDDTRQIATEFGALIIDVPWQNHFANARNCALQPITADWVLVLDADEVVEAGSAETIRALLQAPEDVGGYLVPIRNLFREANVALYGKMGGNVEDEAERAKGARSWAEHKLCRLFRRHPGIYYEGRIHEMVEATIEAQRMRLLEAPFRIIHYGQLSGTEAREQKNEFYRKLGRIKVEEEPNNFLAWYELGSLEHSRFNNLPEALRCLYRATELQSDCAPAWGRIFQIHAAQKQYEQALAAVQHMGPSLEKDLGTLLELGGILAELSRLEPCEAVYRRALQLCQSGTDAYWATSSRLGMVEVRRGHYDQGLQRLEQSAAHCPQYLEHHQNRMIALLMGQQVEQAADVAEQMLQQFQSVKLFLQAAAVRAKTGNTQREKAILEAGLQRFPDSPEIAAALQAVAQRAAR